MTEKKRGKIIVVVAPSGSGKTTIAKRLLLQFEEIKFSVSATTRPPRNGEKDGKDYHFLSEEEFKIKVENGDFLEYETFYGGVMYGTLRSAVEDDLKNGYFCLLDIDVEGANNIKQMYKNECLAIFIRPPSIQILKQRLLQRGTETDSTIKKRLNRAAFELSFEDKFDVTVVNDNLDRAYSEVQTIVQTFINS